LTKLPKTSDGEKTVSSINVPGGNWISACRKLKLDPCLSPCTSINSKWIKDLNMRPETLKLVHERIRYTLELIGIGNVFLNRMPIAQQLRERIDKWDYMKLKGSTQQKKCSPG
jgi:hypothetical protein